MNSRILEAQTYFNDAVLNISGEISTMNCRTIKTLPSTMIAWRVTIAIELDGVVVYPVFLPEENDIGQVKEIGLNLVPDADFTFDPYERYRGQTEIWI